jgi:hypothetical protein
MSVPPTRWASCARSIGRSSPTSTMRANDARLYFDRAVAFTGAIPRRWPTGEQEESDGMARAPSALHHHLMRVGTVHRRWHHPARTMPSPSRRTDLTRPRHTGAIAMI